MDFFDVFISYGREDSKAFAIELNKKLIAQNLNVWFDQKDIPLAVDYQKQINTGIEQAHNFIFIIAPRSVNSPYCLKEIELAIKLNKRIIPLLHVKQISQETWLERNSGATKEDWQEYQSKGLHSSEENMHPIIKKLNWVNFQENDDFEASFADLLEVINKHKSYVEYHTNLLAQALDWERNQKQTNYLLIGEERQKAKDWLETKFGDKQPPCIPTDLHCEFICESVKNANNLMTQIFLSYSEQDRDIKEKIRRALMRESFTIWTNKTDIKTGVSFQEEINKGIEGADTFIYLMSSDSLKSEYCQQELAHAKLNNKRIIPLLIEEVKSELILAELQELQFIDFTKTEKEEQYQIAVDKLLGELKKDPSYYERHKILLVKALKWKEQKENPSLLLRGYNLQQFEAWLKIAQHRKDYPPLPLQEKFITASLERTEDASLEVFISYSRSDSDLARKINEKLQELGKTTWFDQESIATGTDFKQEIYRGIESSDNFLFIISPKSVNSPYCADEVEYAKGLGKRFVTILHRQLSEEDKQKLPAALANVQYLDFNQHGGDFVANFNELVRTLDTDRDYVRSHTEWSQKALEWQKMEYNEDLLLRGIELGIADNWLSEAEKKNQKPPTTDLQKEFIGASKQLRDREQKEKEREQKAELARQKRDKRMAQGIAIGSVGALVISSGLGLMAWQKTKQAEYNQAESLGRYSLSLLNENKGLEAFVQAIKAGKILQKQRTINDEVTEALQKALVKVREFNSFKGYFGLISSVSFSPDGKTLASAGRVIQIWNVETGEAVHTLNLENLASDEDEIDSVSFSPDGKTLVSAGRVIQIWNVETGKEIRTLKGDYSSVQSVSFSLDGKILAAGSGDKTIKLWDVKTGKKIRTLKGDYSSVQSVSFSPDGKTLASGSDDGTIKLWDVEKEKEIRTLKGDNSLVQSVSFSPDGKTLASGSNDGTIKLWDVKRGEEILTLKGHNRAVKTVSFSADGKTLASGSADSIVKLWDVEKEKEIRTFADDYNLPIVSFSPDSKTLAVSSGGGTIKLWNIKTGQAIKILNIGYGDFGFGSDGKTLASLGGDGTIKLWDLRMKKTIRSFKQPAIFSPSFPSAESVGIDFTPDLKTLASISGDGTIKLWSLDKGEKTHIIPVVNSSQSSKDGSNNRLFMSFSPDSKILASVNGYDGTTKFWNIKTGKEIRSFTERDSNIHYVSFSADGNRLATGNSYGIIKVWNVKTGKQILALRENNENGNDNYFSGLVFNPDGKTLAVIRQKKKEIELWDLDKKIKFRTLVDYEGNINSDSTIFSSIHFSPDGKTLASVDNEGTVKLWNGSNGWGLDALMERSCDKIRNYLLYNSNVSESDRYLCDDIGTKP